MARCILGGLALGLVIGIAKFVNQPWPTCFSFPLFPNIFDLAVGAAVGLFLFYELLADMVKKDEKS